VLRWGENISQGDCALSTSDVIMTSLLQKNFRGNKEINCQLNIYLGFLIFLKITKIHHFVTYLSNDPRILGVVLCMSDSGLIG